MSTAGAITVSLEAEIAKFVSAMDKAEHVASERMKKIDETVGLVKTSLTALGAGFSVGLTLDKFKESIEGAIATAGGLQDLSEKTGAAVEKLSGLAAVAKLSGTDTDALAVGMQKLSKSLVDAKDGGAKSIEAFRAIGISVADLKGLKPDDAFQLIAQKMALYGDGAEKTAIAQQLLGKAGANLLPVMHDLADAGDLQVVVTKEQAEQANEYEKNVHRLQLAQAALWNTVSAQVLPVMNAFAKAMLESSTRADGVKGSVDKLAADNTIREWAENTAKVVGFVVDAFDGVARTVEIVGKGIGATAAAAAAAASGEFSLAKSILTQYASDADAIANKTLFSDRLKAQLAQMNQHKPGEEGGTRPTPDFHPNSAAKAANDDPAKAVMEGVIKLQEQMVASQRKSLQDNEAMLQESYSQQYMTAAQFYAGKRQLIEDELQSELAAYSKEMTAAQTYIDQADTGQKKQAGRNALAQAAAKYLDAQAQAQAKLAKVTMDANKPLRDFELATEAVRHQHELDTAAMQFNIDMIGKSTLEVQRQTAARTLDLALQERIYQMKLKGYSADELASRVAVATAENEAQKAITIAQITSAYDLQRDSIMGAHQALQKYVEDSTNGAQQMQTVVGDAFKGMEDALVNFVKTGKLNFSSLVDSIIADVARMVIQQQITGPLAGWVMGGLTSLFNPSLTASNSFDGGILNGLIMGGPHADGGPVQAGMSYLVGEKGPEIFTAPASGQIIPNDQIGAGGGSVVIHINNTIGDVASQSDVEHAMQNTQRQIYAQLSRSRNYGGVMAS